MYIFPLITVSNTCHFILYHTISVRLINVKIIPYTQSFMYTTNTLPPSIFPLYFDFSSFKCRVSKHLVRNWKSFWNSMTFLFHSFTSIPPKYMLKFLPNIIGSNIEGISCDIMFSLYMLCVSNYYYWFNMTECSSLSNVLANLYMENFDQAAICSIVKVCRLCAIFLA